MSLFDVPGVESSAWISDCTRFRYSLLRRWGLGPLATFIMLNPSTADADQDDPTIRRCIGFARRWGCGGLFVMNIYALRSTDPRGLWLEALGVTQAGAPKHPLARGLHRIPDDVTPHSWPTSKEPA